MPNGSNFMRVTIHVNPRHPETAPDPAARRRPQVAVTTAARDHRRALPRAGQPRVTGPGRHHGRAGSGRLGAVGLLGQGSWPNQPTHSPARARR
jgi:hypothetical protein